jgi:hypothetical protein
MPSPSCNFAGRGLWNFPALWLPRRELRQIAADEGDRGRPSGPLFGAQSIFGTHLPEGPRVAWGSPKWGLQTVDFVGHSCCHYLRMGLGSIPRFRQQRQRLRPCFQARFRGLPASLRRFRDRLVTELGRGRVTTGRVT